MRICAWFVGAGLWLTITGLGGAAARGAEVDPPARIVPAVFDNEEVPDAPTLSAADTELPSLSSLTPPLEPVVASLSKPMPAAESTGSVICDTGECPAACASQGGCCRTGQPWQLPQPCTLAALGVKVGGWVEQGITFNGWSPADRFNGPVATNDRSGEYQLNQAWIFLDRPTNTDGCGFDLGGHIDMIYGTDWRFGRTPGLEDRINSANSFYGLCLPQFYLEAAVNDLKVRAGHYATGFGYEQVPAVANFFYSHSYCMAYGEPILVTGIQADYKLNDNLVVTGGVNRGWMMFEDFNDDVDVLSGIRWTSDDKETSISFMTTAGAQNQTSDSRFAYALVYREQVTQKLNYVLQHNFGCESNVPYLGGQNAQWYGLDQYLFYTINPCWSAGIRAEWFRDQNGSRIAGVGNWIGSDKGWRGNFGFDGSFYELTAGLNYRPHPNFVLRPEVRWDWYDGTRNLDGQYPFNGGQSKNQVLAAADLIFTF